MGAEHRSRTRLDRCDRLAGIAEVGGPHGAGDENSVNGIMHGDAVWVVRHVDALHRRVHSRVADDHLVRAHTGEIPSPSRSPPLATACGKALIQVGCRGHGLFRATCVLWNASGWRRLEREHPGSTPSYGSPELMGRGIQATSETAEAD
jgi:hypothetical protein